MSEWARQAWRPFNHKWALVAALALLSIFVYFMALVVVPSATRHTGGFSAYYSASRLLADGEISARIYDPGYFREQVERDSRGQTSDIFNANPPTTSLMLLPLASLSGSEARLVWTALNVLWLLGALALMIRTWVEHHRFVTYALILSVGMLFRPVIANFEFGQAYVLMLFLLSIAAVAYERRQDVAGGLALALALVFKLSGWPLLLLTSWQRRWRFLLWTVGSAAFIVLLALPELSFAMWHSFVQLLPEVSNSPYVCVTAYQTTRSLLCHLFAPGTNWAETPAPAPPGQATLVLLALAAVTIVVILHIAIQRPTAGFCATITWGILFAPLGEQHHHAVMLLPVTWLVLQWREGQLKGLFARVCLLLTVLCYIAPFPYLAPQLQTGWWVLLAYPRLYGAWLALLAIYVHTFELRPRLWPAKMRRPVA